MLLGIITVFPEMFHSVFRYGIIARAIKNGFLVLKLWNPKEFTCDLHGKVDDRPYGGGPGMLMMIEPLQKTIDYAKNELGNSNAVKVVYLSPQGRKINQEFMRQLIHNDYKLILVCGRYQGIDERLMITAIDEEWSIGDYILSGGELASMVLVDIIARILPGVLGNPNSNKLDSFYQNRLDTPRYTRPKTFQDMQVPSVLLSGNHYSIDRWRLKQSLGKTWMKRPDLLDKNKLTKDEEILLSEFKNEYFSSLQKKFK